MTEATAEAGDVVARYAETPEWRVLSFERERDGESEGDGEGDVDGAPATATISIAREGYGMLLVSRGPDAPELERYYGFDMALDHVGELLGVPVERLPVPDEAADMGM